MTNVTAMPIPEIARPQDRNLVGMIIVLFLGSAVAGQGV
jgi:hypothetical protein